MKLILTLLLICNVSFADCQSDCKNALSKADKLIQDLKDQVSVQKSLVASQQDSILILTHQNDEKANALASAFRNPWIMGSLGFIAGSIAVLVLKK